MPNHFEIFELPARYALDASALEAQYRALSMKLHPDRFAQAPAAERRRALEQSTALNQAYQTLRNDALRALYLLKLRGIDLNKEDAGAMKELPAGLLEEILFLREELEEARASKDLARALKMADSVRKRRDAAQAEAASLLTQWESAPEQPLLEAAAHKMAEVRYYDRFLEQVDEMEEELL